MPRPKKKKRPVILTHRLFGRLPIVFKSLFILFLIGGAIFSAGQIDTIREFITNATGEKANLIIDTNNVANTMHRPWRNLAQGGESHDWRLGPLTAEVAALKPNYIRIDHIYDFFEIVSGTPGNLQFNFSKLDLILDEITATGAKPYIVLSYMPSAISSGDIVAVPNDYSAWQLVVQRTIEHISGNRGIENVYYEVWNEPDLFGGWKYYGKKNYLDLYTFASRGAQNAKNVQPFKIGGPGTTALYKNWLDALVKHSIENNLRLDFFSWHLYSKNVDQFKKDATDAKNWLSKYPELKPSPELNITEWGFDSDINPGYDNSFAAAHAVAVSIEMIEQVNRIFSFEIQDGKDPSNQMFWGRWGMFTHGDFGAIAKARYHGLRMLDRVSNQRLFIQGKGSWVKAVAAKDSDGNIEVVIVNYDARGRHSENVPVAFANLDSGDYQLSVEYLGGRTTQETLSAVNGQLQKFIAMTPNSVLFLKLTKK